MAGRGARDARSARTPTVLQMEAAECGAASLAIVLAHFGRWVTLDELRAQCSVSRDGSSARNIVKAARENGLTVEAMRMEPHHVRETALPAIVHWGMNHFLVVEGFRDGEVLLNDPAEGPRTVSDDAFDRGFTGITLSFRPGPEFERQGAPWSIRRALTERLSGLTDAVRFALLVSFTLVFPGLLVPIFTQIFIDQILVNRYEGWLAPLIEGMLACAVLTTALTWLQREGLLRLETRLASASTVDFVRHLTRLPLGYFDQRHAGQVTARVALNDRVAQLGAGDLGQVLLNLLTASAFLLGMIAYAPLLAIVVVIGASMNGLVVRWQARAMADDNRRLIVATTYQAGVTKQGLQMIESYKATGQEDRLRQRMVALNARVLNLRQTLGLAQAQLSAWAPFITLCTAATVLAIGSGRVIEGRMTIGMLVAFQALMMGFFGPVGRLVQLAGRLRDGEAYLKMLDDALDHPIDPEFADDRAVTPMRRISGKVSVHDLSFRYGASAPPLLSNLSLTIAPGERLAIVGASGSGKSTLGRLIAGLQEPTAGEIRIDNVPLRSVPRPLLRRSMAVVEQRPSLFSGSVRDAITLWDDSMPEERVVRAARVALIHDLIVSRPGGYAGRIADSGNDLSGGQRQRLEIARAIALDPRILVLDEATSALDPRTESELLANLRVLGCTTIMIAHRPTAVRHCDRVIVLAAGEIVQMGSPNALMAVDGPFRVLMAEA